MLPRAQGFEKRETIAYRPVVTRARFHSESRVSPITDRSYQRDNRRIVIG